jgi:hypothetical protein
MRRRQQERNDGQSLANRNQNAFSRSLYPGLENGQERYHPVTEWSSEFWSPNPMMIFRERTLIDRSDNTRWRERRYVNPALNTFVREESTSDRIGVLPLSYPQANRQRFHYDVSQMSLPMDGRQERYQPTTEWREFWSPNSFMIFHERTVRNVSDGTLWRERQSRNPLLNSLVSIESVSDQTESPSSRFRHPQAEARSSRHPQAEARSSRHPQAEARSSRHPQAEAGSSRHLEVQEEYTTQQAAEIMGEFMSRVEEASDDRGNEWHIAREETYKDLVDNMQAYFSTHSSNSESYNSDYYMERGLRERLRSRWNGLSSGDKRQTIEKINRIKEIIEEASRE